MKKINFFYLILFEYKNNIFYLIFQKYYIKPKKSQQAKKTHTHTHIHIHRVKKLL